MFPFLTCKNLCIHSITQVKGLMGCKMARCHCDPNGNVIGRSNLFFLLNKRLLLPIYPPLVDKSVSW